MKLFKEVTDSWTEIQNPDPSSLLHLI